MDFEERCVLFGVCLLVGIMILMGITSTNNMCQRAVAQYQQDIQAKK